MSRRLRRGAQLGKYRLESRLGVGRFGEVWKARDSVERRLLALKIVRPEVVAEYGRKAIEQEAQIAVRLCHPNIVAVLNADWLDGHFLIATDLARCSLSRYRGARRSPRRVMDIVRQVAAGLAYAHSQRILHRDVKPENILIFERGRAAIGDFGVSRRMVELGKTYSEAGTLGYLAPEQAYGKPTYASDVFSLGVIAYEYLTGELLRWPFEWPPDGFRRFRGRATVPVWDVIRKATRLRPSQRYPDAGSLLAALDKTLTTMEAHRRPAPRRRRRRSAQKSVFQLAADLFRRQTGRKLGMRFHCYRCDGPIAEEMRICPWCGADGHSYREITAYPLVCPHCEHGVMPEWNYCPWCYEGRFISNGRRPRFDPKATRTCSRKGCEGQLRPFMRYCPLCKQKVRRVWTVEVLSERCPSCRWPVAAEFWSYCPWCGRQELYARG